jgi:ribosome-associated toxin RatA of RatAB toxin-antitoxin module
MIWQNTLEISAPFERLWELTVDVARWSDFMPTMQWLRPLEDGPLQIGSKVRVKQPAQLPLVWTVSELQPPSRFVWQSRLGPWRLTATHQISPTSSGCSNHLQFEFSGPFSEVIGLLLSPAMNWALATENRCFKKRAEG